ncbi:hypothetical protein ABBQ38_012553 [Trebouxia sp. C0009 RCD-2024]
MRKPSFLLRIANALRRFLRIDLGFLTNVVGCRFGCEAGPLDKVPSWLEKMPGTIVECNMYSSSSKPGLAQ